MNKKEIYEQIQTLMSECIGDINDEKLRKEISNKVSTLVDSQKLFYDYLVVCDERNNKADNIDNNELILDLFYKNDKDCEFAVTNFLTMKHKSRDYVECNKEDM